MSRLAFGPASESACSFFSSRTEVRKGRLFESTDEHTLRLYCHGTSPWDGDKLRSGQCSVSLHLVIVPALWRLYVNQHCVSVELPYEALVVHGSGPKTVHDVRVIHQVNHCLTAACAT